MEKLIKETTYFFCVTVVAAESEVKNLAKYFAKNNYEEKIKLLPISINTDLRLGSHHSNTKKIRCFLDELLHIIKHPYLNIKILQHILHILKFSQPSLEQVDFRTSHIISLPWSYLIFDIIGYV